MTPESPRPPRGALRLLSFCCPSGLLEGVEGDLYELYVRRLSQCGRRSARRRFWLDVLRTIRPHVIHRVFHCEPAHPSPFMIGNYISIALRHLKRRAGFSAINVVGLTVGLTCCFLIILFVQHERSFDTFHDNADRIVRTSMIWVFDGKPLPVAETTTMAGPWLTERIPQVEQYVRFKRDTDAVFRVGDRVFKESGLVYADSTLFDVFTFPLIQGDPSTALGRPGTILLTQSVAERYFPEGDALGQTVTLDGKTPFEVSGILADVPSNSHIRFDLVASFASLPEASSLNWDSSAYHTYLLLSDRAAVDAVSDRADDMLVERFGADNPNTPMLRFMPLTDVYLHSALGGEWTPGGSSRYVTIFSAIAALILLIACINYTNLATARAVDRAREVGLRKTLGARKSQLFGQFMGEALFTTGIGIILSIGLVALILPWFSGMTGADIQWDLSTVARLALITWIIVGLVSGIYPSVILARFRPTAALKGRFRASASGIRLRKGLVVFQFAVTTFLVASTLVIYRQLTFIQHKELGFDKEHVVVLPVGSSVRDHVEALKSELIRHPSIRDASSVSHLPVNGVAGRTFTARDGNTERQILSAMEVDSRFVPMMDIPLLVGRNFNESDISSPESTRSFILNRAAAENFGWSPEEAVGKVIGSASFGRQVTCSVVGVVENFHFESLHSAIKPLVIVAGPGVYHLMIRTGTGDIRETLSDIRASWDRVVPDEPFDYSFLDEEFDSVYRSEARTGWMFTSFSLLAIFVAGLGLLGLAAYAVTQRTREIGIRKVLGATPTGIVVLLSGEFTRLVLVAFVLATPLAWFAMRKWLEEFAFRADPSWWIFVAAGFLSLLVALATVSVQSIRAALADPVKSLRSE